MLDKHINTKLQVWKLPYKKRYAYVSEIYDQFKNVIDKADIFFFYGQKNSGKSTIGYNLIAKTLSEHKNVVYGRLQMKEKDAAVGDIARVLANKYGIEIGTVRGYGSALYFVNSQKENNYLRFISMGDYQMTRSTVNENTGLIFFDEINATTFKPDFTENLINIISTMARDNEIKFYGCGNNETAQNNPILSMFQIALDWSFRGLQIAYRVINGAQVVVIQCGGDIFDEDKRPVTLAQRLGANNEAYAQKFLYGINLDVKNRLILNVPEFIQHKKPIFIFGYMDELFMISQAELQDDVNNIYLKVMYYIEPISMDKLGGYWYVRQYAFDDSANMYYQSLIKLDDDEISSILRPFYYKIKNNLCYFKDYETQELFFNLLGIFNDNEIITKVEEIK